MTINEVIEGIVKTKGMKKVEYAEGLGVTLQALNGRMKSNSMRMGTVCDMLHKLGYAIAVVPIDGVGEEYYVEEWLGAEDIDKQ